MNDQYGNKVFYPDRPGRGYIISDKATYNSILNSLEYMDKLHLRFTLPLYIMWCLSVFLDVEGDLLLIACGSVSLAIILIGRVVLISPKIKNLTPAPDRASIKDFIIRQICWASVIYFLAIPFLCILGMTSLYLEYGEWDFGILIFTIPFIAGLAIKLKCQKTG